MSRPDPRTAAPSPEEELRNLLRKIEVAPFSPGPQPPQVSERKLSDYQVQQQQQLEQLWREEKAARDRLVQHFESRVNDVNSPREEPASSVSQLRATAQHPELTDFYHKVLLSVHRINLRSNVDGLAYNNSLVSNVPRNLPQVQVPLHARINMEEFAAKFGGPNVTEILLLAQALGITESTVRAFFTELHARRFEVVRGPAKLLNRKFRLRAMLLM